jgi:hypothetical protein
LEEKHKKRINLDEEKHKKRINLDEDKQTFIAILYCTQISNAHDELINKNKHIKRPLAF